MATIFFTLSNEERSDLRERAKSMGLSTSAYVRNLVRDAIKRDTEAKQTEVLKRIRALVPAICEALGRTQNATPDIVEKLTKVVLDRYDKETL